MIDTRDLQEELESLQKEENLEDWQTEELEKIKKLKNEMGASDFEDGMTLIEESEFEDYCQDLAYDCGYLSGSHSCSNPNPLDYFIDWKDWADHCKMDFSDIEYEDKTYYYR